MKVLLDQRTISRLLYSQLDFSWILSCFPVPVDIEPGNTAAAARAERLEMVCRCTKCSSVASHVFSALPRSPWDVPRAWHCAAHPTGTAKADKGKCERRPAAQKMEAGKHPWVTRGPVPQFTKADMLLPHNLSSKGSSVTWREAVQCLAPKQDHTACAATSALKWESHLHPALFKLRGGKKKKTHYGRVGCVNHE